MKTISQKSIHKIFGGRYVRGEFTKRNGEQRNFWAKIVNDPRNDDVITFFDMHKKAYRRMTMKDNLITVSSGSLHIKLGEIA